VKTPCWGLPTKFGGNTLLTCVAQWESFRKAEKGKSGLSEDYLEALDDNHVEIQVSEVDRDPYGIMINKNEI